MFEKASRLKLRFHTPSGLFSAEDLWDMKLTQLNSVAVSLHHQLNDSAISFLETDKKVDPVLKLQFDIATHVIRVRQAEALAASQQRERAETKQKIMGILARKQDLKLEESSEEELQALLATL